MFLKLLDRLGTRILLFLMGYRPVKARERVVSLLKVLSQRGEGVDFALQFTTDLKVVVKLRDLMICAITPEEVAQEYFPFQLRPESVHKGRRSARFLSCRFGRGVCAMFEDPRVKVFVRPQNADLWRAALMSYLCE